MITAEFTHGEVSRKGCLWHSPAFHEVMASPQSLESERNQYLKDFGSNRFSFVREVAERVVEQNNQLIQKLESLILSV
jgi:hypothetical protein